ncbi:LuxR C-terminal-related transcriptional regulator [Aeromicrobium sp. P5_D10]
MRRLDRFAPITFVQALSGNGKTTLAAMWAQRCRDRGDHVVWLHASVEVNRPAAFLSCLHAALGTTSSLSPDERVVVVIDDLQHLDDPAIVEALATTIRQNSHIHLVACVDAPHSLAAAARRHHIETNTILGVHLTIGRADIRPFAEAWGHDVCEEQADQLYHLIGGWLLPLRLVLDTNPIGSTTFATDAAQEFLEHDVMARVLDTHAVSLAMRLALARSITEETAGATLAGMPEIHGTPLAVLQDFQRIGLLQRRSQTWHFPTLVRHTLVAAFEREHPDEARDCHRALARSLHESGADLGQVLWHARRGEDWARLASLWTVNMLQLTVDHPDDAVFAYSDIPESALATRPALTIPGTIVHSLVGRPESDEWRMLLRKYMDIGTEALTNRTAYTNLTELGITFAAAMIAQRVDGNPAESRDLALRFNAELERPSRNPPVTPAFKAWFYLQWGMTELLANDLPRATQLTIKAFEVAEGRESVYIASNASAHLALIHALTGATSDARHWLDIHDGFDTSSQWMHHLITLPAHIARALLHLDQLDVAGADAELKPVGDGVSGVELWPFIALAATRRALLFGNTIGMLAQIDHLASAHAQHLRHDGAGRRVVHRCRADLLISLGRVHSAQRLIDGAPESRPSLQASSARIELITGHPERARQVAAADSWEQSTSVRARIDLLMIQAAGALAMGDAPGGQTLFDRAMGLAHYARIQGASLLVPKTVADRFADPAAPPDCGVSGISPNRPFPEAVTVVRLSPRETAVLELFAEHDSIAEMARALTVSVNTVKKQTVSIYAKLGVHDRRAALLRARQLGLLAPE